MGDQQRLLVDVAVLSVLLIGIWRFREPKAARAGTLMVAVALAFVLGIELVRSPLHAPLIAAVAFVVGAFGGLNAARRVTMTQIPALVGLQNGAGGLASCLVAFVGWTRGTPALSGVEVAAALFALIVGAATFSGSMVASGKLANWLRQTPLALRGHGWLLLVAAAVLVGLAAAATAAADPAKAALAAAAVLIALLLGILVSMRVGGADMPVLISLLNALSGLSAGFCGIVVQSQVLTACGAMVAASGLILTYVMCRAMNRSLAVVLLGTRVQEAPRGAAAAVADEAASAETEEEEKPEVPSASPAEDPLPRVAELLGAAQKVLIVPGYGMALAHAQTATVRLADLLVKRGKDVKFAVHPLAGRMPGHMHVLLAEAEVDPDMLFDLDEVNSEFSSTDVAVVIGACDVVNPAAVNVPGTPISGMPILAAHEAKQVVVCNLDTQPGYSGVDNPLYKAPGTMLLLGDAQQTVTGICERLRTA